MLLGAQDAREAYRGTDVAQVEKDFFRTRDLDEAIAKVGDVYCPHTVQPKGAASGIDARLGVVRGGPQPLVYLRYSTAVAIDAGTFPNLLLMMSASSGQAAVRQGGRAATWRVGQTMPLSPDRETLLDFDREFAQTSLRVDIDRLETQCAAWLGHPLDRPLQLALHPLADPVERLWQETINILLETERSAFPLPQLATEPLVDFLLSLILHRHPHNHSAELTRPVRAAVPRLVAAAEQLIRERAAAPVDMGKIAGELGVSLRSLQLGFRTCRDTTPSAFLQSLRLESARRALVERSDAASVTAIALEHGFTHMGRFSLAYKARYGESPVTTLRRRSRRPADRR
jgi:AraC-like DNA-binding protein